ncbi:MAG: peptide chain release factor N(5)-glutamine methyltransferase [Actinomycetota bacterium]|nr:peptide chain release factor N(5)-glutamine methyltransferase [Actinomycetota bacterium]
MPVWNVKNILEWAINYFSCKEVPQPRLSAELLLGSVLGLDRVNLYLNYNRVLNNQELATYKKYILERLEHTPIQYILNEAYFRKIKLYVDEKVLIPRPETELIVDKVFQILKDSLNKREIDIPGKDKINILEIGTGSGAIAISLANEILDELKVSGKVPGELTDEFPEELWEIVATDNDSSVLDIAERNAHSILNNNKFNKIKFIKCDIVPAEDSDFFKKHAGGFKIIISNPPYISEKDYENLPREVKEYEPKNALLGGETGLEIYERILNKIKPYINQEFCYILFEIAPLISTPLEKMSKDILKPSLIKVDKDYNGRERVMIIKI